MDRVICSYLLSCFYRIMVHLGSQIAQYCNNILKNRILHVQLRVKMLSESINSHGTHELAVNRRIRTAARSNHGSIAAIGISKIGYFFHEYIWSGLILMVVMCTKIFRFEIKVFRHEGGLRRMIKRTVDIFGALVGLVLTLPFFIILPILIKLDSPGPVFYWQARVGHNRRRGERRHSRASMLGRTTRDRRRQDIKGRPIYIFKFRTMVADAEKKCGPIWATRNDPRITRLGMFLRKTRLDEIPQFANVLLGQMSLVGPRPERPIFVKELSGQVENYEKRLDVKPGITGLAQVESGYDSSVASVARKVHYDLEYIRNWSFVQDIKILMKTVIVVITGKGAF